MRSFIVSDWLPIGHEVVEITTEDVAPHLHSGDFAIVDPSDREPAHDELFIVQWNSGRRAPVIIRQMENGGATHWKACMWNTFSSADSSLSRRVMWFDGPYELEGMRQKIIGRIVGIYQPDFRAQLRIAA